MKSIAFSGFDHAIESPACDVGSRCKESVTLSGKSAQEMAGIQASSQKLILKGKERKDAETLASAGVKYRLPLLLATLFLSPASQLSST
jgi:hypothetical protein